jgi:hypothetical protein
MDPSYWVKGFLWGVIDAAARMFPAKNFAPKITFSFPRIVASLAYPHEKATAD